MTPLTQKQNTQANKTQSIRPKAVSTASLKTGINKFFVQTINATRSTLRTLVLRAKCLISGVITLTLVGCGGDKQYPAGWPALVDKLSLSLPGRNCPDMKGLYSYDSMQYDESAFEILSTVLGSGVEEKSGMRWSIMTIKGDAATALTVNFEGSGPRSNEFSPTAISQTPITQTISLQRGVHYKCESGWLVGEPQAMSLIGMDRTQISKFQRNFERGNERKSERYPTRSVGLQTARLRLDSSGSIVALSDVSEAREFSIWPGTRGIKYWVDVTPRWARWQNEGDAPGTKISPQVLARIERELSEMENGTNVRASVPASGLPPSPTTPIAPGINAPPTAPIELPTKPLDPLKPLIPLKPVSGQDLQALVQNMSDGSSLEGVTRQGERIVVRLHFTDPAQIASTIKNLSESGAFTDIEHRGTIAGVGKNGIATISMKQR